MRQVKHELTNDTVVLKMMEELQLQGKTEKDLEQALHLTTGAFVRWKYQNGKSYQKYLNEIAEFLHVTTEYLLERDCEFSVDSMTQTEMKLIQMYRRLTQKQRNCVFSTAECLLECGLKK